LLPGEAFHFFSEEIWPVIREGGDNNMDDIEAQIVALERIHAALAKVRGMGGAGVLLPGHLEDALSEIDMAEAAYAQLMESLADLKQQITMEHQRLLKDSATFKKFER
jgi:hypothetical protein